MFAIERVGTCWQKYCNNSTTCEDLYCVEGHHKNFTSLNEKNFTSLYENCRYKKPDDIDNLTEFNFGMFTDALKSGMVLKSTRFRVKLSYCFWWGFRNLR